MQIIEPNIIKTYNVRINIFLEMCTEIQCEKKYKIIGCQNMQSLYFNFALYVYIRSCSITIFILTTINMIVFLRLTFIHHNSQK